MSFCQSWGEKGRTTARFLEECASGQVRFVLLASVASCLIAAPADLSVSVKSETKEALAVDSDAARVRATAPMSSDSFMVMFKGRLSRAFYKVAPGFKCA